MNLILAMVVAVIATYWIGQIVCLMSLIMDDNFMAWYKEEFERKERRRLDRRKLLNSIYGVKQIVFPVNIVAKFLFKP